MVGKSWEIGVANPSPYERSDYVEVDLNKCGVDSSLGASDLKLFRVTPGGGPWQEVPYQIDHVLGNNVPGGTKRVLTFLATNVPGGPHDDYRAAAIKYVLEQGTPTNFLSNVQKDLLWVGQYYEQPQGDEPADGFNRIWAPGRNAYGVKLKNGRMEVYFSLVPHPKQWTAIDYAGAMTSLWFKDAEAATGAGEMLAPFQNAPEKRWGQIANIAFFPFPWQVTEMSKISLLGKRYELVWANAGTMRATVTVRSEPFVVVCRGNGVMQPEVVELRCRLYRVLSVYPEKPFVAEDVFVLTEQGMSLRFRACYYSHLSYPHGMNTELKRFEHIPDYFAFWKDFSEVHRGLGFASDMHIREVKHDASEIQWRLQLSHVKRCVHYAMFHGYADSSFDKFHDVGHFAWYERAYKPLRVVPFEDLATIRQYSFEPFNPT